MDAIVIQLVQAVKDRDHDTVNMLLDSYEIDLNTVPGAALVGGNTGSEYSVLSNSGSILHMATSMCHRGRSDGPTGEEMEAILARLLGAGASPLAKDFHGYTPLHWACELGSDYAVRLLLEAGAPVNAVDSEGSTPLHRLCCTKLHGSRLGLNAIDRLLEPLLAAGADPTVRQRPLNSPSARPPRPPHVS